MNYAIYLITRTDGQQYVGSTRLDRYDMRMYRHKNSQRFEQGIYRHQMLWVGSKKDVLSKEKYFVEEYDTYYNGLNHTIDGSGNPHTNRFTTDGTKHREETKRKIGLKSIGRRTMLGKKHSLATRRRMSEQRKGKRNTTKLSLEQVQEILSLYHSKPNIADVGKIQKNGRRMSYEQAFSLQIAEQYNMTPQGIRHIITRKTWANVPIPNQDT